ncbi:MAG: SMP-30/gluconolactonase/LRE family protein, partial [Deltaproteobacteria bacterium]|nr:SMP-30/gluconolactonase/LRE family protein [Deltaproteobacteria bacterium]
MLSGLRIGNRTERSFSEALLDFFPTMVLLCLIMVLHLTSPPAGAQTTAEITVLGRIPTDQFIDQVGLAPGSGIAYGLAHRAEALYIFDLETDRIRVRVDLGRKPVGLAVDSRSNLAYVIAGKTTGSRKGGYLAVINPEGLIIKELVLAECPQDLALDPETGRLIISAGEGKKLLIHATATLEKVKEIPLPASPRLLALDPDSGRAVVIVREKPGAHHPDRMVVLDLESGAILQETVLAAGVEALAVAQEKDLALVLNREKLQLLDINQGLVIGTLPEIIPHCKKGMTKDNRSRSNEYFGLEVNQATQLAVVSGQGGLLLIDLDTRTTRNFSVAGVREIRAVAVDRLRNTLLGSYWTADSRPPLETGLLEIQLPNPRPELAALNPVEAVRGLENQFIAIEGQGFLISSEGYLADQLVPIQFLDNQHLQLLLPAGAVTKAGLLALAVVNPEPEGGRSNSLGLLIKNPAPALTGLNPVSAQTGTPDLVLNVFGVGFLNDSNFLWNGTAKPFTLVGNNELQVTLTASDLETVGDLPVAVFNPGPGGGFSNTATFSIRNPEPLLFSLSPRDARAGAPGITLTLTGANFLRTTAVFFNQVPVTTVYIDGAHLEAQIPAELIQAPGSFPVQVVSPGPGGGSSGSIDFLVSAMALLPAGSYGKKYEDLVPPDATLPRYDPLHFSLLTGLVNDRFGNRLGGVEVSILGRPEYGTARTGSDGRYSLPVDGGGTFTLRYGKSGFLEAQRQVEVGWNTIAAVETLVLIVEDSAATSLVFDGNPVTVLTHTGSPVSDASGRRALTMVFSGDNRAWVKDAQGVEQPLSAVTVRATEYATPAAMPAKLPPNSAFTYCAELSVDGARNVRFEKPVMVFVDNFLGFNVGDVVPVGFYDRDRGAWIPADNGKVVRLLDTNGDGVVDAYADGQGQYPAPGLTDTARFVPNSTFWRVEISHFTPWVCNWPYGPAPGAIEPNPPGPPVVTRADATREITCINSYVDDRGCVFHEDLPLPGTDFWLHYAADRTPGYKPRITIPASGPAVPASLIRILVRMELAGRTFEAVLPPQANQQTEFIWDGLDHLGREVTGSTQARIRIGFEYPAVYYAGSSIFEQAFAQPGSTATWIQARENIIAWRDSRLTVDRGESDLARGWTLSSHHLLNPSDPGTLHKGDGTRLKNNVRIITTAAAAKPVGDGISILKGLAFDRAGALFFTDRYNYRYMKLEPGGEITYTSTLETPVGLVQPYGLAVDGSGNLYLTSPDAYYGGFIVKVDPSGGFTIIAGNRQKGFSGDGGPATAASFNWPEDLTLDGFGNIYITDTSNNRIRKIDPNGIITTVAGNGQRQFTGDGGPAVQAALAGPRGVKVDPKGNLYIADTDNNRIRKVDRSGIITTVAGNGLSGFAGDGGPATQARLSWPRSLALDQEGNLYLADTDNYRIRKVDVSGIISTIAGNGERANDNGDGGPAVQATVHDPYGVAVDSAGNVYAAIWGFGKIKKISFPGAFKTQPLEGDTIFADENGQGYVLDNTGAHRTTYDLATGKVLLTFDYDQGGRLTAVTDRFGNRTAIERDASGLPLAITAVDGRITRLAVDEHYHLTGVTYPDGAVYTFAYTPEGLLTGKTDPRGRTFGNQYEPGGLITGVWDPEGGFWNYTRTIDNTGQVSVTQETAEGNATIYRERTDFTGDYTATRTDPSGAVSALTRSADELTETEQTGCGMEITRNYGLDPVYRYRYSRERAQTSPSGLLQQQRVYRTYQDTNGDRTLDTITRTINRNGNIWTNVQNTLAGTIIDRSPLGRTVTRSY